MQEYLQKTHLGGVMNEAGTVLALLFCSLGGFVLLWGLRPMALTAGTAAFILCLLLRRRTRAARLQHRENQLRRRIGGELKLEEWTVCPSSRAHFETALLLGGRETLVMERMLEEGVLCRAEKGHTLVACAQLHRAEQLTARDVAAFQRACLRSGAESGYLCGASGASDAAREQAELPPPVRLVDRERMITLAGAANPATDSQLVSLGRRKRKISGAGSLPRQALQPDRAEKYLLYGSLLLGLYLLSGQTHYVIYGLLCLSLMTACRVRNAKTKGP